MYVLLGPSDYHEYLNWSEENETYVTHKCRYTITVVVVIDVPGVCFLTVNNKVLYSMYCLACNWH